MEIRIKPIAKKNSLIFAVQIRKSLFWRTLMKTDTIESAERIVKSIKNVDELNNKNNNPKIIVDGWAVRNIYNNGVSYRLGFFRNYPTRTRNAENEIFWIDSDNNTLYPFIEIDAKSLFNKDGLIPTKLRITIEEIED